MKFAYIDESGTGDEPFAVMVSIIVDSKRMHVTKADWSNLLEDLSKICGNEVKELHTRDFYNGRGIWYNVNGSLRSEIIDIILDWLKDRKHKISFTSINKEKYLSDRDSNRCISDCKSIWCMMAMHKLLILQKHHQSEKNNKGNTVFIFDNEKREEKNLFELIENSPDWLHEYYEKKPRQERFDQLVDVPYFGDSESVNLLQIADLIAYFLRRYAEIKEGKIPSKYSDEEEKITGWVNKIKAISLPQPTRYPKVGRNSAQALFYDFAVPSLRVL